MVSPSLHGLWSLLAWLSLCAVPMACAQPAPASGTLPITSIVIERQCFGCPAGERLELTREGRARLTSVGSARHGTADSVAEAPLAAGEFERLARAVVAAGFFTLDERYEEEGIQDGEWVLLTVVRNGAARQVFRREQAGPPALARLLATLEGARAGLRFVPLVR